MTFLNQHQLLELTEHFQSQLEFADFLKSVKFFDKSQIFQQFLQTQKPLKTPENYDYKSFCNNICTELSSLLSGEKEAQVSECFAVLGIFFKFSDYQEIETQDRTSIVFRFLGYQDSFGLLEFCTVIFKSQMETIGNIENHVMIFSEKLL